MKIYYENGADIRSPSSSRADLGWASDLIPVSGLHFHSQSPVTENPSVSRFVIRSSPHHTTLNLRLHCAEGAGGLGESGR